MYLICDCVRKRCSNVSFCDVHVSSGAEVRSCSSKPEFPGATLLRYTPDKALFKCAEGHEPAGGSPVVRCSGGQWNRLTLLCRKKSCGNAGELLNGRFTYNGEPDLGAEAYASCDDGFTLTGPKVIKCGVDGWSKPLPKCEEGAVALTCLAPDVANSEKKGLAQVYKVGDVLTVRCSPDFQTNGAKEITCGSDGQWQPPLLSVCPQKCPSLSLKCPLLRQKSLHIKISQKCPLLLQKFPLFPRKWSLLPRKWSLLPRKWSLLPLKWSLLPRKWSLLPRKWSLLPQNFPLFQQKILQRPQRSLPHPKECPQHPQKFPQKT
ncbi:hypothetical protein WMY93_032150, partial [Mugilogobius chulae]